MELWRTVPDGAQEKVPGGRCPRCASPRVHRSRTRSPLEALCRLLSPFRAFKCSACRWRGWRVPVASDGPDVELPPLPSHRPRGAHHRSGSRLQSPTTLRARRRRLQLVVAVGLALAASAVYVLNQESLAGAGVEASP